MDTPDTLPTPQRRHSGLGADWATRNPTLLLRFSGLFLLRLAERKLCGLLFHEPPRNTRPHVMPYARINTVSENNRVIKPCVSACRAWPIQLCTDGLKSPQSARRSA